MWNAQKGDKIGFLNQEGEKKTGTVIQTGDEMLARTEDGEDHEVTDIFKIIERDEDNLTNNEEKMLAGVVKQNTEETSIATIKDKHSKRVIRDALEHAEQEFSKAERHEEISLIRVLKDVMDSNGSLVIEGREVRKIRKDLEGDSNGE